MDFYRFPRTPHLLWLGTDTARDDKVLSSDEAARLLEGTVLVEEKVDGANVGFSVSDTGHLQAQNRGTYLERQTSHPQFRPLFHWMDRHRHALVDALGHDLILFGEWCYAVHSVSYTALPDWFLAFDVYDQRQNEFWSADRRDALIDTLGITRVPTLASGRFSTSDIIGMIGPSQLGEGPAEGVYVRRDEGPRLAARAKVVRPEFVQQIEAHWSGRTLTTNRLASGATW